MIVIDRTFARPFRTEAHARDTYPARTKVKNNERGDRKSCSFLVCAGRIRIDAQKVLT